MISERKDDAQKIQGRFSMFQRMIKTEYYFMRKTEDKHFNIIPQIPVWGKK